MEQVSELDDLIVSGATTMAIALGDTLIAVATDTSLMMTGIYAGRVEIDVAHIDLAEDRFGF